MEEAVYEEGFVMKNRCDFHGEGQMEGGKKTSIQ